ncbi:MAG TPA: dephospho-CoA kinase [Acidobacteriaceae bacterium]
MLRVGLTGGLGSGKSAVALVFAEGGAHVLSADDLGRRLMQPGQQVFHQIVDHFGPRVLRPDGLLDRGALADAAFAKGRLAELNAIVHPAVFRAQEEEIARVAATEPQAIVVVESALIFEAAREAARHAAPAAPTATLPALTWRRRFDRLVLVTAPDQAKIDRYVARVAGPAPEPATRQRLEEDARRRLAAQIPDAEKAPLCDYLIENTSTLVLLRRRAQAVLQALRVEPPPSPAP